MARNSFPDSGRLEGLGLNGLNGRAVRELEGSNNARRQGG